MLAKKTIETLKKYTSEFLLIFISVLLAFAMIEWSNNNNDKLSEEKLLKEIKNGLDKDIVDFNNNVNGNNYSLKSLNYFRRWVNKEEISQDSIGFYYSILYRSYAPIINKSGYESLKSTSLKTISNDSLRNQIINLYEYHYKIIETLEIEADEMQDFKNYYGPTNTILSNYFIFDKKGNIISISKPNNLTTKEKNALLSYFWKVEFNRNFKLLRYKEVIENIKTVDQKIEKNLNKF